jgi:hypothetical protein
MNASPVDVLGAMDQAIAVIESEYGSAADMDDARAAVAELLQADREYDEAQIALHEIGGPGTRLPATHPAVMRFVRAEEHRRDALAKVQR